MNKGIITQIIGAVIDVKFTDCELPKLYKPMSNLDLLFTKLDHLLCSEACPCDFDEKIIEEYEKDPVEEHYFGQNTFSFHKYTSE